MDVDSDDSGDIQFENYLTASKVYRDLWTEFYSWEQEFCRQTLESLSKLGVRPRPLPHEKDTVYEIPVNSSSSEQGSFTYEDISPDSTAIVRFTLSPDPKIVETKNLEPSPGYTACTPASTNIVLRDDPHYQPFAPYADDPLFDLDRYLTHFERFTWQYDLYDPDLEMIQLEAVRRLRHGSGFGDAEIKSLEIFPPLRDSNRSGLIWYSSQRDFLWWPGSQISELNPIRTNFVDHSLQIHENILKDAKPFCPNLNCIQTHCSIHKVETNEIYLPKALVTNGAMISNLENKCGDFCYKDEKYHTPAGTENKHWSKQDQLELESFFKLMPDTSPCDLAIICRKPCFEIYNHRKVIFSDEEILENQQLPRKALKIKFNEDEDIDAFVWIESCHHKGPCNQYTDCNCYKMQQRCQRMCSCSKNCSLKFRGCKCHSKKEKVCTVNSGCPCVALRRECNPEVCLKCDARGEKASRYSCQNNKLQRGQFPAICVHKSKYGLGAFAGQNIARGTDIGEYVALICDAGSQAEILAPLQKFTGLNYSFQLNSTSILDAWSVGNEIRYINDSRQLDDESSTQNSELVPHPPAEIVTPNCEASIRLVNDVHRIVITAVKPIRQGRELYLDYGDTYWNLHT
ncbi:SET domain-containing protein [Phlegmacium glaucopus]|nr:SET domain-containing protein [Phlegmacium glaucopus]